MIFDYKNVITSMESTIRNKNKQLHDNLPREQL